MCGRSGCVTRHSYDVMEITEYSPRLLILRHYVSWPSLWWDSDFCIKFYDFIYIW